MNLEDNYIAIDAKSTKDLNIKSKAILEISLNNVVGDDLILVKVELVMTAKQVKELTDQFQRHETKE